MTLPPCHEPGRPRSVLRRFIMCLSLTSHPLRVSGAASTRPSIFCLLRGALPGPAQTRARSPSRCPPPASPTAARSSPRLRSPRRPSLPRAPRSRRFVCLRAQGLFAQDEELRGRPAHPLCRPKDRLTAPRRLSLHHTLSLPLSHHSHLPPRQLPPPQPHPPSSPCASRYPTPLTLGGTARAAVRRPSCVVVASLCILLSKRSLLFKIRVRSGLAVRSARSRPKNPGQGGSSVASGPTGVPMRRSIFTRNASCEGLLT